MGINIVSDRLPLDRRIGRPVCLACGQPFRWRDYLLMKPCQGCSKRRSYRSWIVQITSAIVLVVLWFVHINSLNYYETVALLTLFGVIAVIDIEHRLILHPVSLVGALIGAYLGIRMHGWLFTMIGGVFGYLLMLILFYLGELFSKALSRARGEPIEEVALGFGDVNLAGVLGLITGTGIIPCLLSAILLGGIISGIYLGYQLINKKYQAFSALPYAPFLLIAAFYIVVIRA
jgi:hypothetical protein